MKPQDAETIAKVKTKFRPIDQEAVVSALTRRLVIGTKAELATTLRGVEGFNWKDKPLTVPLSELPTIVDVYKSNKRKAILQIADLDAILKGYWKKDQDGWKML